MTKRYWLYIIPLFLSHLGINAQELTSINFDVNSPLQTNTIYDIHFAADGLLYIATDNGFWSYNGLEFKTYQEQGLKTQDITNIQEGKNGHIFFQNFSGEIFCWNKETLFQDSTTNQIPFKITEFQIVDNYTYYWNLHKIVLRHNDSSIVRELVNPQNTSWLLHQSGGNGLINRINDNNTNVSTTRICKLTPNGLKPFNMYSSVSVKFCPEYAGEPVVLIPSSNHNGKIINQKNEVLIDLDKCKHTLKPFRIRKINNQPWVGCVNGLYIPYLNTFYLRDFFISEIIEDSEKNIWLSTTNKGLIKIPNLNYQYYPNPNISDKIDLILKHNTNLIYSTATGDLFRWSKEKNTFANFFINSNNNQLKNILYSDYLDAYITSGNYVRIFDENFQLIKEQKSLGFLSLYSSREWYFMHRDRIRYGDLSNLLISNFTLLEKKIHPLFKTNPKITPQRPGYLSFRSHSNTSFIEKKQEWIVALRQDTLTFVHEIHYDSVRNYIIPPNAQKVYVKNDRIWVEFPSQLVEYDDLGKVLNTLPRVDGIKQNISNISIDDKHIAISTKQAVFIYNGETMEFIHQFTTENGISSIDFEKAWIYDNALYTNGSKGINKIPLDGSYNKGNPTLNIGKVFVNKKIREDNKFGYGQNNILINLNVRSFTTTGKIYWRLNEKEWKILNGKTKIELEELQYGYYKIEAYFENNLGRRSSLMKYQFHIQSPFWLQTWFILFIGLFTTTIVALVYKFRIQQIKARNMLENNAISSQLIALKSQMNPHFIFNSLNSIQNLIRFNKNKEAYKYINKFAVLLRQTLHYSDKDYIPLEKEIELLSNYLNMEKMRFDGDLDFNLGLDGDINVQIPTMIIQPFVENAIKHGLLHKKVGDKKLDIHFDIKKDTVLCTIIDNGIGRDKAREIKEQQKKFQTSFSTGATKKRLELLQQLQHKELGLYFTDLKDSSNNSLGTKVEITLPIYMI